MNSNNEKIKKLILEIMSTAVEKTNNTEADIFVNFVAHVNSLEVSIYEEGWMQYIKSHNQTKVTIDVVYLDRPEEKVIKKLSDMLKNIDLIA